MGGRVPHISEGTETLFVGYFETYKGSFFLNSRQLIEVSLYVEVTHKSIASSLPGGLNAGSLPCHSTPEARCEELPLLQPWSKHRQNFAEGLHSQTGTVLQQRGRICGTREEIVYNPFSRMYWQREDMIPLFSISSEQPN